MQPQASHNFASILLQCNNGRLSTPMLVLLAVICFAICIKADTYLEACAIRDNKNVPDRNSSIFYEDRTPNNIPRVLGSIENVFVHEVLADKRRLFVGARQLLYKQQIYPVPVDKISGRLWEQWAMQKLGRDKFRVNIFHLFYEINEISVMWNNPITLLISVT
jgi:hypothetical protein